MPGSVLSLFTPLGLHPVLFGLFDYLVPIVLYCIWSTLAFLDLAQTEGAPPRRRLGWCAIIFLLPAAGAAAYLLFAPARLRTFVRSAVVGGGLAVVTASYVITFIVIH